MTAKLITASMTIEQHRSEYFYDMLDQLLIIGRQAGGDALIDATLIGGLLASRKAQLVAQAEQERGAA